MTGKDEFANPYRSPGQSSVKVPLSDYYVLNSSKLAYRELWSLSSNWFQFLALCLFKLVGHRVTSIVATRIPESMIELEVETVRRELREELDHQFTKLDGTGLKHLCYVQSPVVGQTEQVAKIGFSPEKNAIVVVQHLRVYAGGQRHTVRRFIFQSPLGGGRYLWTIAGRQSLWHSSECDVEYFPARSVLRAWQRHLERTPSGVGSPRIPDGLTAKTYLVEWWRNEYTHHVARGVYDQVDVDQLDEIRKLQEQCEEHWPEYVQPDYLISTLNTCFIGMFVAGALPSILMGGQPWSYALQWIAVFGILVTFVFRLFRKRLGRQRKF